MDCLVAACVEATLPPRGPPVFMFACEVSCVPLHKLKARLTPDEPVYLVGDTPATCSGFDDPEWKDERTTVFEGTLAATGVKKAFDQGDVTNVTYFFTNRLSLISNGTDRPVSMFMLNVSSVLARGGLGFMTCVYFDTDTVSKLPCVTSGQYRVSETVVLHTFERNAFVCYDEVHGREISVCTKSSDRQLQYLVSTSKLRAEAAKRGLTCDVTRTLFDVCKTARADNVLFAYYPEAVWRLISVLTMSRN